MKLIRCKGCGVEFVHVPDATKPKCRPRMCSESCREKARIASRDAQTARRREERARNPCGRVATESRVQRSCAGGRRLMCDPVTSEKDYTDDEAAFLRAMDRYKRSARRPFPTLGETLEVLVSLGYRKVAEPGPLPGSVDG